LLFMVFLLSLWTLSVGKRLLRQKASLLAHGRRGQSACPKKTPAISGGWQISTVASY